MLSFKVLVTFKISEIFQFFQDFFSHSNPKGGVFKIHTFSDIFNSSTCSHSFTYKHHSNFQLFSMSFFGYVSTFTIPFKLFKIFNLLTSFLKMEVN